MNETRLILSRSLLVLATGLIALTGGSAIAQVAAPTPPVSASGETAGGDQQNGQTNAISSSSFDRGRNTAVLDEPRPDYQAIGIHVPGFMIYPRLGVDVAYDSNIYALQYGAVGDTIFSEVPEVDVVSTWSRNALSMYARAQADQYVHYTNEDAFQYGVGASGRYDLGVSSSLSAGLDFAHDVLPRAATNSVQFSVHRIPYDYLGANGEFVTTFTRMRVSVRLDDQDFNFQNGTTPTGQTVFESQYDHNNVIATGKLEFALSPDAAVYTTAMGNERRYSTNPPFVPATLNSSGWEWDVGANFDLTHLVRGEVQLGYLQQVYVAAPFQPLEGLGGKAVVQWFPQQMTTVTFTASRSVGDSGVPGSAGFLNSLAQLKVDHELLRNLILSGMIWGGDDKYNGIARTDDLYGGSASAMWLVTRHVGLTFSYTYTDQQSSGAQRGPSWLDNRVMLATTFQF